MSPLTTIKQLDGLNTAEIQLLIANSERKTVDKMEEKLEEHRVVIEQRLDSQDDKLATMQEDLTALVGSDKVPGQVTRLTGLVEGLVEKHDVWHGGDLEFRTDITQKVTKLAEQHEAIAKDVRQVKWVVKTSYAIAKLGRTTIRVVREGKDIYKLLIGGVSGVALVQVAHAAWPLLKGLLHAQTRH